MNTVPDARRYSAYELLRDGGSIHIRSVRPDDRDRLHEHFHTLSPRSVYTRFFGPKKDLSPAELSYFTEMDGTERVGLLATLRSDGVEKIIGVGRYFRRSGKDERHCAEVAFAVSDGHQRRGIASVLLEHLARIARSHGIREFVAEVLGENNQMMGVFARSGFKVSRSVDHGVFHVMFPTGETPSHEELALERTCRAAAASVQPLLAPRSIAVVGASGDEGAIGGKLMQSLVAGGFRGRIHPVSSDATEIHGHTCVARVSDIGEPVDLAILATPAPAVAGVVADCAAANVRAIVVLSPGFAEAGDEGRERERALFKLVRDSGMRMVGPNSLGIVNTDPEVQLHAVLAPEALREGSVAMLSQSGGAGLAMLDLAGRLGIGVSSFVSLGNKADVSGNDVLSYWADDARTHVIAVWLESFGNPRKFARIASRVARTKPIVTVHSARSASFRSAPGHAAGASATGAALDTLFEQCGVIRTDTVAQLAGVAALLASQGNADARDASRSFATPEDAAHALSAIERYRQWQGRPDGRYESLTPFARDAVRATVERVLEGERTEARLEPDDVRTVLRAAGIAFLETTDVPLAGAGTGEIEGMVGATVDPVFGPIVVAGACGLAVEDFAGACFHLTPVSDVDAEEMLDRPKPLAPFTSRPGPSPGQRTTFIELILRVSALVEAVPEIARVELDPVRVPASGRDAIVANARIRVSRPG